MKPETASNETPNGLPADAVKIGTVRLGESPRTSSFGSKAVMVGGYAASWLGSILTREVVSDLAKENVAAHELVKGEGYLKAFQKGINRAVDLKLWKSNVAEWGVLLGGILLTNFAVKKIEQHTFASRHGEMPRMDQVNQILKSEFPPEEKPKTNWQDKTKKADEVQQSISM